MSLILKDDSLIFEAYKKSKKTCTCGSKSCSCCARKMKMKKKKKMLKEHHDEEFDQQVLSKTLGEFLDELENAGGAAADLYRRIEEYLEGGTESVEEVPTTTNITDTKIDDMKPETPIVNP